MNRINGHSRLTALGCEDNFSGARHRIGPVPSHLKSSKTDGVGVLVVEEDTGVQRSMENNASCVLHHSHPCSGRRQKALRSWQLCHEAKSSFPPLKSRHGQMTCCGQGDRVTVVLIRLGKYLGPGVHALLLLGPHCCHINKPHFINLQHRDRHVWLQLQLMPSTARCVSEAMYASQLQLSWGRPTILSGQPTKP